MDTSGDRRGISCTGSVGVGIVFMRGRRRKDRILMKPETRLQIDLVSWIRKAYPKLLFTSTQAGDRRSVIAAMMMKRMGYTPGTPDLIVFHASAGWNGLLLELKTEKGVLSPSQIAFRDVAESEGYKYKVAYGLDEAQAIIKEYV